LYHFYDLYYCAHLRTLQSEADNVGAIWRILILYRKYCL